ncbi:hypothetical protein KY348_07530 [Candidatus Woesearchaeota archaeon]|nr:hypothetical protein [Candidatus Woesearchaeota archaeon]
MNTKLLFLTSALFLLFLISFSGVSAYYPQLFDYDYHIRYNYYEDDHKYPTIMGPFPRGYLWHRDADKDKTFTHDDFGYYDSFIGYKDLDVFNPDGSIDVIRNPSAREADWDLSHIPEGMQTFGTHVYGYIPEPDGKCSIYKKHYDDHPWELGIDYGWGYGYGSYTPFLSYQNKQIYRNNCQSISGCEYRSSYYGY